GGHEEEHRCPSALMSVAKLTSDRVHDRRVSERGGVAHLATFRRVLQQATHDLARASLRELVHDEHVLRLRDGTDLLTHPRTHLLHERVEVRTVVVTRIFQHTISN